MPDLADDLARIAALRGRPLGEVMAGERERQRISLNDIMRLFSMNSQDTVAELRALDQLPKDARRMIRECCLTASPIQMMGLIRKYGDVHVVIAAVNHFMPHIVAMAAQQHYGPDHPQAHRPE